MINSQGSTRTIISQITNKSGNSEKDLADVSKYLDERLQKNRITLTEIVNTRESAKYHLRKYKQFTTKLKWLNTKFTETMEKQSDQDPNWYSLDEDEEFQPFS